MWIACVLSWREVRRDPMPPGRWTALFFLDEATALAAGTDLADTAVGATTAGSPSPGAPHSGCPSAARSGHGRQLHAERVERRTRRQVTRAACAGALPDGAGYRPMVHPSAHMSSLRVHD